MTPEIIRANGQREAIPDTRDIQTIERWINADTLDTVNLRNGFTMFLDDGGHAKGLPINAEATKLYHSICRPGTTWPIVGDVVVVRTW